MHILKIFAFKIRFKTSKKIKLNRSGLTLVEMLVSLGVVMLVTVIFIFNYHDSNKRTDLIMASQTLVSDIHRAQNNSLGLLEYGDELPAGGWGVYFDLSTPDKYIVFADLEGPGEPGYQEYNPEIEGDINKGARIVELAPEIEISEIRFGTDNHRQQASVSFLPPDPRININSGGTTSTTLYISVKNLRDDTIKTMLVNFLGLAEIIN
jgi:hypothetical protein